MLGFGACALCVEGALDGLVPLGSAICYDYRTIHRGGWYWSACVVCGEFWSWRAALGAGMPNTSANTQRPLLQFFYHQTRYMEQRNYGQESVVLVAEH
jgi:hypothetical protein